MGLVYLIRNTGSPKVIEFHGNKISMEHDQLLIIDDKDLLEVIKKIEDLSICTRERLPNETTLAVEKKDKSKKTVTKIFDGEHDANTTETQGKKV